MLDVKVNKCVQKSFWIENSSRTVVFQYILSSPVAILIHFSRLQYIAWYWWLDMARTLFIRSLVVVNCKKCIPLLLFFAVVEGYFFQIVCLYCYFYTVYLDLYQMFIWWDPLLFVTCVTHFGFHWFELLHMFLFFFIISVWHGGNGTTMVEW